MGAVEDQGLLCLSPGRVEALPMQELLLLSQSEVAFEYSPALSPRTPA